MTLPFKTLFTSHSKTRKIPDFDRDAQSGGPSENFFDSALDILSNSKLKQKNFLFDENKR